MSKTIYSFPDITEPEKTTSWTGRDAPVAFVDNDLEDAKRRTALLKERMSPEGALKLPPLLDKSRLKYGIPDGAFKSQAVFDRIHVFPIDAFDGEQVEKSTGGIYKPKTVKLKDKQEGHRGVLISAGLIAADRLMSHGIELGHIVITNKNVPFANRCEAMSNFDVFYLIMRDADLASSETLREELCAGQKRILEVAIDGGYQHQIAEMGEDGIIDNIRKKQSVYINDTW